MATEKQDINHLERAEDESPATSTRNVGEAIDDDPVYSYAEQRKIIHRVDIRLITVAGIIYMNSLMDRSNLPNAGIAGMRVDLDMLENSRYVGCSVGPLWTPNGNADTYIAVDHCSRVFHHLHVSAASGNTSDPQIWTKALPFDNLPCLGCGHGWVLVCYKMVGACASSTGLGHL